MSPHEGRQAAHRRDERIYDGWNTLDLLTVEAPEPDGTLRRHKREIVDHGDAAVVLADRPRARRRHPRQQWRTGLLVGDDDPYLLEACAGLIDPGETPEETARREAEEEIGLKLGALTKPRHHPSLARHADGAHVPLRRRGLGRRPQRAAAASHEGEDIEVVEMPLAELYEMARSGAIPDAKTLVIVQRLMLEELGAAEAETLAFSP